MVKKIVFVLVFFVLGFLAYGWLKPAEKLVKETSKVMKESAGHIKNARSNVDELNRKTAEQEALLKEISP